MYMNINQDLRNKHACFAGVGTQVRHLCELFQCHVDGKNMKYCHYHHYIFIFFLVVKYIFWRAGRLDDPPVQPGGAGRDADH